VADPWADDFAALGEHTRHRLRSLAATRASLSTTTEETKMRFFKTHPALATLIAILALGAFAPIAYAVVHRIIISIDADKPASEIQDDVQKQLEAAGVNADVHVDKSDEDGKRKLEVSVTSNDPNAPEIGVHVDGKDESANSRRAELRVEVKCDLTPEQQATLRAALTAEDVGKLAADRPAGTTDAEIAAKIKAMLAAHGLHDVDVTVTGESVTITINAPPTAP
jgi:hypothetical protein